MTQTNKPPANPARFNPAYPLLLFQRVITVSLETMKIVKALPSLGDLSSPMREKAN